jgi:tetratricopeptide (TPR) repeat protein
VTRIPAIIFPEVLARTIALILIILASATSVDAQSNAAELNAAGWKALQQKNAELGALLFAKALVLQPNDPISMFGAAAAAYLQGRIDEARWRLGRALDLDPRLTEASRLLGEIAYQSGDVAAAIATYERALRHAPNDAGLARALKAWRDDADVHGAFTGRRDQLFTILYEGRHEEATAVKATTLLKSAFQRIAARLGAQPSQSIFVVLYTEKQFRDITGSPEWADGVYDGRIRIATAGASHDPVSFEHVLTHELTHAMIWGLAPRGVPAWLHEGLAQYFAGRDVAAARRRMKASAHAVSLKDLEPGFGARTAGDARLAYDVSLVAVSLIVERAGFGWGTFFSDLAEGTPCETALIRRFGYSYADLEAALRR